jgi:hypothetical protein
MSAPNDHARARSVAPAVRRHRGDGGDDVERLVAPSA